MPKLVTLHSVEPTDDLSDDRWDAEVLLSWLRWKVHYAPAGDTTPPPPSAYFDTAEYADVSQNPEAWKILPELAEWPEVGLTMQEAVELVPAAPALPPGLLLGD